MTNIQAVTNSLLFAKQRLDELKALNGGDLAGANTVDRQRLVGEFFFHLASAIDILMHVINQSKALGIATSQVEAKEVKNKLRENDQTDPLIQLVEILHPKTRTRRAGWLPLPQDPYSENSSLFRVWVFRHWVNHCGQNPFFLRSSSPRCSLFLDPRQVAEKSNPVFNLGGSKYPALDELQSFLKLVKSKCSLVNRYLSMP